VSANVRKIGCAVLVFAAGICLLPRFSTAESTRVFVSVLPQKYFAERLGGARVSVSVMVGPGQSPATYEPRPAQMTLLEGARIYFRIGAPFENVWMDRLREINPDMTVVHTGEQVTVRSPGDQEGGDPHIWTSPLLADHIARTMKDAFAASDPDHRDEYEKNYSLLAADLRDLDADIRRTLATVKTRRFMVYHPSWGYFADSYGLEQIAIEHDGSEPGARRLAELIELAEREKLDVIFVQSQFSRRNAEAVASAANARIVVLDPLAEDYITNLKSVAALMAEAMQ